MATPRKGEPIGLVNCPFHDGTVIDPAEVCENKRRALYFRCEDCGSVAPQGHAFQEWLRAHMRPLEDGEPPPEIEGASKSFGESVREFINS